MVGKIEKDVLRKASRLPVALILETDGLAFEP